MQRREMGAVSAARRHGTRSVTAIDLHHSNADYAKDGRRVEKTYIAKPLSEADYETAIHPYVDWFQLDHPKFPFMQVRGYLAEEPTRTYKLMAGLTGATNCCFVNESGLAAKLCGGCIKHFVIQSWFLLA